MKDEAYMAKLNLYNSMLPHGYKAVVAERVNCAPSRISEFLRGKYYSKRIEDAMLDVIAELQTERADRLKKAGLI